SEPDTQSHRPRSPHQLTNRKIPARWNQIVQRSVPSSTSTLEKSSHPPVRSCSTCSRPRSPQPRGCSSRAGKETVSTELDVYEGRAARKSPQYLQNHRCCNYP